MSVSRHCAIYKAVDQKWYLELADSEYDGREEATCYGPFFYREDVDAELAFHSNPGGNSFDDSATEPVPRVGPDGSPVSTPLVYRGRPGFLYPKDFLIVKAADALWYAKVRPTNAMSLSKKTYVQGPYDSQAQLLAACRQAGLEGWSAIDVSGTASVQSLLAPDCELVPPAVVDEGILDLLSEYASELEAARQLPVPTRPERIVTLVVAGTSAVTDAEIVQILRARGVDVRVATEGELEGPPTEIFQGEVAVGVLYALPGANFDEAQSLLLCESLGSFNTVDNSLADGDEDYRAAMNWVRENGLCIDLYGEYPLQRNALAPVWTQDREEAKKIVAALGFKVDDGRYELQVHGTATDAQQPARFWIRVAMPKEEMPEILEYLIEPPPPSVDRPSGRAARPR